jgi:signal transduction histidine kinase
VPTDLPNLPLAADVRHNVFLAVKEALNNAMKHSGATEVWLRLKHDKSEVRVCVEDNGKGFESGGPSRGRNGLENINTRLAECGGRVQLQSAPAAGCRIWLIFPCPGQPKNGSM